MSHFLQHTETKGEGNRNEYCLCGMLGVIENNVDSPSFRSNARGLCFQSRCAFMCSSIMLFVRETCPPNLKESVVEV